LLGVAVDHRLDDRVEVAVEHLHEVVRLVAAAVVGDPVVRPVVGADLLRPVDRADLGATGGSVLLGLLLEGEGQQPGTQDAQGRLLVLQLALLVLHRHHDAGRDVGDAYGGVGRVVGLTTRS
jgi:hypothetical protein